MTRVSDMDLMPIRTLARAIATLTLMTVGVALAQTVGGIKIEQPWSRATPAGASVAGGFVRLTNTGDQPDRLLGATFAKAKAVEIHSTIDDAGVMKMRQLPDGVALAPGATVELKPGGMHLMLLGLTDGLTAGDKVTGTLQFEKAGSVDVEFSVAPLGAAAPATDAPDHGSHDGHHHQH